MSKTVITKLIFDVNFFDFKMLSTFSKYFSVLLPKQSWIENIIRPMCHWISAWFENRTKSTRGRTKFTGNQTKSDGSRTFRHSEFIRCVVEPILHFRLHFFDQSHSVSSPPKSRFHSRWVLKTTNLLWTNQFNKVLINSV